MSLPVQDPVAHTLACWKTQGVAYNAGASAGALLAVEHALATALDPAFAAYLRRANGMVDFDWDAALFSFWSTTRIVQELGSGHPAQLLCFADHCINLCSFGYRRGHPDPTIYRHYQHEHAFAAIADSFADFLRRYLLDPGALT